MASIFWDTRQPEYDLVFKIKFLFIALPFLISPQDGNAVLRSVGKVIISDNRSWHLPTLGN